MQDKFPADFLWGAATSSHQVEGNNTLNDWWEWEQAGGSEPSGRACDHYARFKDDFRLAKSLNHNAHRFSLEWSRLEKAEGVWDQAEWDHYKAVLDALIALNIEPIVTVNHFTLPQWLSHKGGWTNEEAIKLFARFSAKAVEKLGSRAKYWIAMNEPYIVAFLSYYKGEWPPCEKDLPKAIKVAMNLLEAHVEAYKEMKDISSSIQAGIAKAVTAFHPCSDSPEDQEVTQLRNKFYNHSFISSAINGEMDLSPFAKTKKLSASGTVDFIGLNYYFRQFVHHEEPAKEYLIGEICGYEHHKETGPLSNMGWEIYPEGLYEVVKDFSHYDLPIMITENGTSVSDDSIRRKFIQDHLVQLLRAINEGSPVTGYLYWSLMDNFEWAHGYSQRFGLVEVDFKTQARSIRDSARYYASVISSGKIGD